MSPIALAMLAGCLATRALIGDAYPQHRLRPIGDVDLLVPRSQVSRALRVLGEAVGRQPDPVRADIRATVAALMGTAPGQTED